MYRPVWTILLLAPLLAQAEPPLLVQQAFAVMSAQRQQQWRYTMTLTDTAGSRVERHDPDGEPVWMLVSVDGGKPPASEVKRFRKQASKRAEASKGNTRFVELALDDSWKLLDETDAEVRFQFIPRPEKGDPQSMVDVLRGVLVVDKLKPHVKSMQISATRPFKPMALAKVSEMQVRIEFAEVQPGVYLPVRSANRVVAKMLGINKIQDETVTYSDYRQAGYDSASRRSTF